MLVGCGTGNPSAFRPSMWKRIASRISCSTSATVAPGRHASGKIGGVGGKVTLGFLDYDRISHQDFSFRPACLRRLFRVPGARSSESLRQADRALDQNGTFAPRLRSFRDSSQGRWTMGRGLLLWLIGIPLPIILIIWLLGGLN